MKIEYLDFLRCPKCRNKLRIEKKNKQAKKIESGSIICLNSICGKIYPIINFIPRFVEDGKYAKSFGQQWKTFARTQLDNSVYKESKKRWNSEIGWNKTDLKNMRVIEFGCGAGRFVDIVSKNGAKLIVGVDITDAVDAAQNNSGRKNNVFFVQADFFNSPFINCFFDRGYSIGVLHHTPDPETAFSCLVNLLNKNAKVGISVYEISLYKRPNKTSLKVSTMELLWALNLWRVELFRVVTTRIPLSWMLAYCKYFVPALHYVNKIPIIRYIRYFFPSTCYKGLPVEWSMLDTNDTYATLIVHQYRHKDIFQWFMKKNIQNIIVHNSIAGWVSLTGSMKNTGTLDYKQYLHEQPIVN